MTFESIAGVASIAITMTGWFIGQAEVGSMGGSIVALVTQFGGLGLAVWLVYQHTTVTIPNLQKEHREERQAALIHFKEQIESQRSEYLQSLKELTDEYKVELKERRQEIIQAIRDNSCKAKVE